MAKEKQFDKFAQRIPELNIVSDNPLQDKDVENEQFNLRYRVGPIFDIIRHDKTQTPMTIAIYGTWGTGKTTAMKWLDSLLKKWNEKATKPHRKVRTVWFYPWKYHKKEEVWRGLVSEVIIESIDINNLTFTRARKALKDFGLFLGRSFINVIASATIKAEVSAGSDQVAKGKAGLEFDLENIKDIAADFDRTAHPEKAFLNEFEVTLKKWITETISSQNERMVIFIDDLDRCTPDVAFEVLEALKLYLNIEDLIFVIGLDREVIDKIVENHYTNIGFTTEAEKKKSKKYLDKMFQVEVKVGPSLKQIRDYTDYILDKNEFLKNNLKPNEYSAVKDVVLSLGGRNPREIKRLVNSALMEGMGANLISKEVAMTRNKPPQYTVAQGVQLFLIDKILRERYPRFRDFIGSGEDVGFFGRWSGIVREHFSEDLSKASFKLPQDYKYASSRKSGTALPGAPEEPGAKSRKHKVDWTAQEDIPSEFHEFLRKSEYSKYFELLEDEDLGRLMLIEYPQETGLIKEVKEQIVEESQDDEKIFDDEIRRIVNVEKGAISDEHYASIEELDLSDKGLKTLPARIFKLTNLQSLSLSGNQLTYLPEAIGKLTNLKSLNLWGNQLTGLPEAITKLTNLQSLDLDGNHLTTLPEAIVKMTNLQSLDFRRNQLTDLPDAIGKLTNLKLLILRINQLTDLPEVICELTALQGLFLGGNQLATLPARIAKLTNLQSLDLSNNQFTALPETIGKLTALRKLNLTGNQLTALPEAIGELTALKELNLVSNQLTTLPEAIAKLTNLQTLNLPGNQLTTLLGAITKLTNLKSLNLGKNKLTDLPEAIVKLTNLQKLDLRRNKLTDLPEAIGKLTNLQKLFLMDNQLTALPEVIAKLPNLQRLNLSGNKLTDLPEAIVKLTNLKGLYLENNNFSKEEKERIKSTLPKNCTVRF